MGVRPPSQIYTEPRPRPADHTFESFDYALYALTVVAWSASWFAIALQVGTVPNEVSLVWRFAIATMLMFGWLVASGGRLRLAPEDHLRAAALGILIFSTNFLCFYYGAQYLVSGLLSVVFSLASVINLGLAALVMRERPPGRVLIGGLLGFAGIALMFLPEIDREGFSGRTLTGLAFCIAGTISFCAGNLISASCYRRGLPIVTTNAWGMLYGTIWSALLALLLGKQFTIEVTPAYLGSLAFLAVVSTVMAFAAYLTLLNRIGAARAGYATVIFPVFALLISTGMEGYSWTMFAFAGLVLVAIGNVLVIRGKR